MVMYSVEGWLAPGAPLSMSVFEVALGDLSQWRSDPELHVQYPSEAIDEALERLVGDRRFFGAGQIGPLNLIGVGGRRFDAHFAPKRLGRISALPVSLDLAALDRLASLTFFMSAAPVSDDRRSTSANRKWVYDSVFEGLPDGWAERTESGQWRVVGLDLVENPEGFVWESWSVREAAVIEALGRDRFFDPVSGWIPDEDPPVLQVAPYPVYLWVDGALVVQEPDGSTRPAALDGERLRVEAPQVDGVKLLANQAALFEEEFRDMGFGEHLDDAPLSWVEVWAKGQTYFEHGTGVELLGSWFGEQFIASMAGIAWEGANGGWRLRVGGSLFDPFDLAEGLIEERAGTSVGLFMAAIRAAAS